MKSSYLFQNWPHCKTLMRDSFLALFLDYDGTLAPIVDQPSEAVMTPLQKKALESLLEVPRLKICIISGRSLKDLKTLIQIPGIFYVGNHGFELEGPEIQHIHPGASAARKLIQEVQQKTSEALKGFPGVWIEDKQFTFSVHYRGLEEGKEVSAEKIFKEILQTYLEKKQISFHEGKKVWEIHPASEWNKGNVVLWLYARFLAHVNGRAIPVYIGDDKSDEEVFEALKHRGLSIRVTPWPEEPTNADYYVNSPKEVFKFLESVKDIKEGEYSSAA